MTGTDFDELVRLCKKKSAVAQQQLYKLLAPKLFGVCLRYAGNRTEAEDILQDGFVKIFTKIGQFDFKGSFEGWARRVVVNCALTHYRRESKLCAVSDIAEYDTQLSPDDARLAGLWNNMALTLVDLGRYGEAEALYKKAADLTRRTPGMQGDAAISLLNLANLIEARDGLLDGNERICACLDEAEALLNDPALPRDGYHAFVCEKCAPTFGYYGYFAVSRELEERAETIYAGT